MPPAPSAAVISYGPNRVPEVSAIESGSNCMPLAAIIFGWPAVGVSIVLKLVGIASSRWRPVLWGVLAGYPFLFYLFLTPRFRWIAAAVACFDIGAVRALRLKQRAIALVLALPFILLAAMVARLVLRQYAG